jgi:Zn-dependent protease
VSYVSGAPSRTRFHQYGPWILGGGALSAAIVYEAARHHVVSRFNALFFLVLVPTIILHEISHGVVAYWCGDTTAKDAHRLSLNPIRHIDPIGTVLLPILLIFTTGSAFGWAKPVPVSVNRLRHPRNQSVLVSLAGPALNIALAAIAGVALRFSLAGYNQNGVYHLSVNPANWPLGDELLFILGITNVFIAAFNLIPIPPLDGSAVLERFLPRSALPGYYRIRSYSMVIVLFVVLFAPGVLNTLFSHAESLWTDTVFPNALFLSS